MKRIRRDATFIERFCIAAHEEFKEHGDVSGATLNVLRSVSGQLLDEYGRAIDEGNIHVTLEIRWRNIFKAYEFSEDILLFSDVAPEETAKKAVENVFQLIGSYLRNKTKEG